MHAVGLIVESFVFACAPDWYGSVKYYDVGYIVPGNYADYPCFGVSIVGDRDMNASGYVVAVFCRIVIVESRGGPR